MLDHVSITVNALSRGVPCGWREARAIGYGARDTGAGYPNMAESAGVVAGRRHWRFRAGDRAAVRAFHAAGQRAGGQDDGAPGLRPRHDAHYGAAFLLDPDGNHIEAVCHAPCSA